MKILPVSFCGIIGACKTEHGENEYFDYSHTTLNYYPFNKEPKEETDKFVREYEFNHHRPDSSYRDDNGIEHNVGNGYSASREVKVLGALPFTKEEYEKYNFEPEKLDMRKRLLISAVLKEIEREKNIK